MAVRLNAPTKMVFNISVILGVIAILLYLLGVFGIVGGGTIFWGFWAAVLAWGVMLAGVCMKGV